VPTDYEKLYQQQRNALGDPFAEVVAFFEHYDKSNADVLDLGCGQGRDALMIARGGHHVIGVDWSRTGIAQLLEDAQAESLHIDGTVADISDYRPTGRFDVIVIDRTLHMLDVATRLEILARFCPAVRTGGYVLIADEKSNLPAIRAFFEQQDGTWKALKNYRGFLFMRKAGARS